MSCERLCGLVGNVRMSFCKRQSNRAMCLRRQPVSMQSRVEV